MGSVVKRHPVLSYYLLAFGISWGAILTIVGPGGFVSTTATSPTFALVGLASLLGPSLAGVIMTGLVDGRAGFRELVSRLLRWQVGGRWYAIALLTAPLVTLATLVPLSFASRAFLPAILTANDKASLFLSGLATGLRGVNYFCRLTTTTSAGEGSAKGCGSRPDRHRVIVVGGSLALGSVFSGPLTS